MRREDGWLIRAAGVDVRAGLVPLGMVIERTYGSEPIVVPESARSAYPLVVPMASGTRVVMIRAWSIVGWSMAIGAAVALVPAGLVCARRAVWRREGKCVWCGYALGGIGEGAVCPECGEGR